MGLISKSAKKVNERHQGFEPRILDEGTVQATFNRCVASSSTVDPLGTILFPKSEGFKEQDKPIYFDREHLEKEKRNILYLLGQLRHVHEKDTRMTPVSASIRYNGETWSKNNGIILELFYLGEAIKVVSPFNFLDKKAAVAPSVKPTLSPKDPNFPAWWEAHKGEWEE